MKRNVLIDQIKRKESLLCVGLDTDINRIPSVLRKEKDPIFEFNKRIVDATLDYAIAYKPNLAFYEALGAKGWESLQRTMEYIPSEVFTIADAKRGDIGNTSSLYAKAFFENMNFDSVTVAPYMGEDSVKPFLAFDDKWVILLGLTSNPGSNDFQNLTVDQSEERLFERVLRRSQDWGDSGRMMYVIGATKANQLVEIRKIIPDHFLLVPGVGAQGGDLEAVCKFGLNKDYGLLINSSRSIIYANDSDDFDKEAAKVASGLHIEMKRYMDKYM